MAVTGWNLVSRYQDSLPPIDGDPDFVEQASAYYGRVAASIQAARDGIIAATEPRQNMSLAVYAFVELAREVKSNLDRIDERYTVVSEQTAYYAGHLRDDQRKANHALATAQNAEAERRRAVRRRVNLEAQQDSPDMVPANFDSIQREIRDVTDDENRAEATIRAQWAVVDAAIEHRSGMAAAAAAIIEQVVSWADLNDGMQDKISHWVTVTLGDAFLDFMDGLLGFLEGMGWLLDALMVILAVIAIACIIFGASAAIGLLLLNIVRVLKVVQTISTVIKWSKLAVTTVLYFGGRRSFSQLCAAGATIVLNKAASKAVSGALGATPFKGWVTTRTNQLAWGGAWDASMLDLSNNAAGALTREIASETNRWANTAVNQMTVGDVTFGDYFMNKNESWGKLALDGFGVQELNSSVPRDEPAWDARAFVEAAQSEVVVFDFDFASATPASAAVSATP